MMTLRWVLTPKSENDRYGRKVRNSSGIAVFAFRASDKAHWVEVGRCYERFALQATALGILDAFLGTPYSGDERHTRRIGMLSEYETTGTLPPLQR